MLLLFWKIDGKLKDTLLKMYQIMYCFQATKVNMSKYIQKKLFDSSLNALYKYDNWYDHNFIPDTTPSP